MKDAIKSGNPEAVKLALSDLNPQWLSSHIDALLAYANNPEIVKLLLQAGAKPDAFTLNYAINANYAYAFKDTGPEIVKLLLQAGAKPGENTLNYALNSMEDGGSHTGNLEIVKLVLKAGAKPNERTDLTHLRANYPEIMKLVKMYSTDEDPDGRQERKASGFSQAVEKELAKGSKKAFTGPEGHYAALSLGHQVGKSMSQLKNAINSGNPKTVKSVLQAGVKPDGRIINYAISIAINDIFKDTGPEIVKLILQAGAKPDENALNYALNYMEDTGNPEIVKLVLKAGAKPNEHTDLTHLRANYPEIMKLVSISGGSDASHDQRDDTDDEGYW